MENSAVLVRHLLRRRALFAGIDALRVEEEIAATTHPRRDPRGGNS